MRIIIRNTSGKPINEGDILPSIRQLASELKINVVATTRAYSDLE